MLVSVQGLGSVWEQRIGHDPDDPLRYSKHAAFYNTTGVFLNGKFRYRWVIGGKLRFEGSSWFDSVTPHHNIHKVFECDEPEQRTGWIQMCCKRRLAKPQTPDWFLFVLRSDQTGRIPLTDRGARSGDTYLISASAQNQQQEVMLLMKPGAWIRGERGCLIVQACPERTWLARLASFDKEPAFYTNAE